MEENSVGLLETYIVVFLFVFCLLAAGFIGGSVFTEDTLHPIPFPILEE